MAVTAGTGRSTVSVGVPRINPPRAAVWMDGQWHYYAQDVARIYGVGMQTLAEWRSTGDGPPFVVHRGRALYPLRMLASWSKQEAARLAEELSQGG